MGMWENYQSRTETFNADKRSSYFAREERFLKQNFKTLLSYYDVTVNGEAVGVSIENSTSFSEKTLTSLNPTSISIGSLVEWNKGVWLVVDKDPCDELYSKFIINKCNHALKWIDKDGIVHEQWCVVASNSITSGGESTSSTATIGVANLSIVISKNADTERFKRGDRFFIDDNDVEDKLVYEITKLSRISSMVNYTHDGVYTLALEETVSNHMDNSEIGVTNYYKYIPKISNDNNSNDESSHTEVISNGGWL